MARPTDYNMREKVNKYLLKGLNQAEIAKLVEIDPSRVSRLIKEMIKDDKTFYKKNEAGLWAQIPHCVSQLL